MKTSVPKKGEVKSKWLLINASGKTLGRLATQVASLLIGKGKVEYAPHVEVGDHVVIINAKDIVVTGRKRSQKVYDHYSGYPGGRKTYTFEQLIAKKPTEIIKRAVRRMLPKNKLGDRMMKHLRVYAGGEHQHQAQKIVEIKL